MPFYTITLVNTVDEDGKPQSASMPGAKEVRQVQAWDKRTIAQLHTAYAREQALTVTRLGAQHSPGRPLERRGEITIFFPFLATLEDDVKQNVKQPDGPVEFLPRSPREEAQ